MKPILLLLKWKASMLRGAISSCLLMVCWLFCVATYASDSIIVSPYDQLSAKTTKLRKNLQTLRTDLSLRLVNRGVAQKHKTGLEEWLLIDAVAKGDPQLLLHDLLALGLKGPSVFGRNISGQLPLNALEKLDALPTLNEVRRSQMIYSQGTVVSQGDRAQQSDSARQNYAVTGKGITVAVLSDSFDCLGGMQQDQEMGELPQQLLIVEEILNCEGATDEGRALAQIVHDIAPDAQLIFQSSANGLARTANAILDLAFQHNANVILDDMKSLAANFYQEDAISQAIQRVTQAGVVYVTAAGNSGRNAYQSSYNEHINTAFNINAHDFDPHPAKIDIYQRLKVPEGEGFRLLLQWETPAYSISGGSGARTDLDIFIFDQSRTNVLAASAFGNVGRDPVEAIFFNNPENSGQTEFDLMITKAYGDAPRSFKYIILNSFDGIIQEYHSHSGGLFGHANTEAAISVGASNYFETPAFGITPPLLQSYSSAGGQPIVFDIVGDEISPPKVPQKPDIVAPDNVNNSFFGATDEENDGLPNIAGSSAATPHAGGVAALLLEANSDLQPADVKAIFQKTALDILQRNDAGQTIIGQGVDPDSGYGLLNADAAVALAKTYGVSQVSSTHNEETIIVNDFSQVGGGGAMSYYQLLLVLCFLILHKSGLPSQRPLAPPHY